MSIATRATTAARPLGRLLPMRVTKITPLRTPLREASAAAAAGGESVGMRRLGAVIFSGICGGTACLCAWQLRRYDWKVSKIEERTATLAAAAQPLRAIISNPADGLGDGAHEFERVILEGTFDHTQQVLVGPRSAPAGAGLNANVPAGAAGASGWDVLAPLVCADGSRVLVNRGWVPRENIGCVERPTGTQVVEGVLKAGEARNKYATNDVANGRYIWLDLPTLAAETGSSPLLVVAVGEGAATADGKRRWPFPRPLDSFMTFHVMPMTHLVYAATWASLSAACLAIKWTRFHPGF